jgi:Tol biopolymer transport system component
MRRGGRLGACGLALALALLVLGPAQAQSAPPRLLAPAGRQLAWLNLDAPRPMPITHLDATAMVTAVAVSPTSPLAAISVNQPIAPGGAFGEDLLAVDLTTQELRPLLARADAYESLTAPVWWPDGSAIVYQREDRTAIPTAYAGSSVVLYPTRVEVARADGSGRTLLVDNARQPALAPDGTRFVFLRASGDGTALVQRTYPEPSERVLVLPGPQSVDLASPRYSPQGDVVAFMAPSTPGGLAQGLTIASVLATGRLARHGWTWDLWLVNVDGSATRRLAALAADDGMLAWSPDGSQIFVYGGLGSFLVEVATAEVTPLGYVAGYGAGAWLAD